MLESKFSLAYRKNELITVNMYCVQNFFINTSFISVSLDASSRKSVKVIPIITLFFLYPIHGIKIKLLEFLSVEGKTSYTVIDDISSVKKFDIADEIVVLI